MAKFCANCGKRFNDKAQFCDECGVQLKEVINDNESTLENTINATGEKLSSLTGSAKEKLNEALSEENKQKAKQALSNAKETIAGAVSEENKEKAKQVLNNANATLKENGIDTEVMASKLKGRIRKPIYAVVAIILIAVVGGYSWYNQDEKAIARVVEENIAVSMELVNKMPGEYTDDDLARIVATYEPSVAPKISEQYNTLRMQYAKASEGDKKDIYTMLTKLKGIMEGAKVGGVTVLGEKAATATIINDMGLKLGDAELIKVEGEWKIKQPINYSKGGK